VKSATQRFFISQPGSSVATSLSEFEAKPKYVSLLTCNSCVEMCWARLTFGLLLGTTQAHRSSSGQQGSVPYATVCFEDSETFRNGRRLSGEWWSGPHETGGGYRVPHEAGSRPSDESTCIFLLTLRCVMDESVGTRYLGQACGDRSGGPDDANGGGVDGGRQACSPPADQAQG
jgi:hypothetical protein